MDSSKDSGRISTSVARSTFVSRLVAILKRTFIVRNRRVRINGRSNHNGNYEAECTRLNGTKLCLAHQGFSCRALFRATLDLLPKYKDWDYKDYKD